MSDFFVPNYVDPASVLEGLRRLQGDLQDLNGEIESICLKLSNFPALTETEKDTLTEDFLPLHRQLSFFAAEIPNMQAALGNTGDLAMSTRTLLLNAPCRFSSQDDVDPILMLYSTANSLLYLAETLPEEHNGLSHLIYAMGEEVRLYSSMLDDEDK